MLQVVNTMRLRKGAFRNTQLVHGGQRQGFNVHIVKRKKDKILIFPREMSQIWCGGCHQSAGSGGGGGAKIH